LAYKEVNYHWWLFSDHASEARRCPLFPQCSRDEEYFFKSSSPSGTALALRIKLTNMKAKILLADDDAAVLAALRAALVSEGYEVIIARDGREAIERFREGHVDIRSARSQHAAQRGLGSPRAAQDDPSTAASDRHNSTAGSIPVGSCRWSGRIDGKAPRLAPIDSHN
jgi:hypothetical protein